MRVIHIFLTTLLVIFVSGSAVAKDLLPSWNDGPAKNRILEFVAAITDKTSKDYVEPAERIAVFDNDGTLSRRSLVMCNQASSISILGLECILACLVVQSV